jgi:hypothetical protein
MNANIRAAAFIPLKLKIEIIDKHYPNAKDGDFESYKQLFKAYKKYISGDPDSLSLNCEGCQTKVMSGFGQILNHWKNG